MRIGLAQINTTVGDLPGNRRRILDAYAALVAQGAELVVFPELAVCGYPPRDLLFKRHFVPDVEDSLRKIASQVGAVPALIGTVVANPAPEGRRCFNAAALCQSGAILRVTRKCLLPTYDVFDEDRYFQSGRRANDHRTGRPKDRANHLRGHLGGARARRGRVAIISTPSAGWRTGRSG